MQGAAPISPWVPAEARGVLGRVPIRRDGCVAAPRERGGTHPEDGSPQWAFFSSLQKEDAMTSGSPTRSKGWWLWLALAAVGCAALVPGLADAADKVITIGAPLPLTGPP